MQKHKNDIFSLKCCIALADFNQLLA